MSLLRRWGLRGAAFSFVEMILFFLILTPIYLAGVSYAFLGIIRDVPSLPAFQWPHAPAWLAAALTAGIAALPIWVILLLAGGYFVILVFYWIPGRREDNDAELRGFAVFLLAAIVAGGAYAQWQHHAVTTAIQPLIDAFFKK